MTRTDVIAIFGAGAIGCWIGGRLAAAGADVMLIARQRVADELVAHGLTVSDLDGATHTLRVSDTPGPNTIRVSVAPTLTESTTHVFVTVKSAQTREAGETLAKMLPPRTSVVSFQNGVRNVDVLRAALPDQPVVAAMVPYNVVRRGPGVFHRGSSGTLMIERERLAGQLVSVFADAGLALEMRDDMPAVQWAKLVMNLNNAINALAGIPLRTELSQRAYRRCLAACQREALTLLAVANIPVAKLTVVPPRWMPRMLELPDRVFRSVAKTAISIDPHARSSMWDDLEAGRPTEIDYLQGEVVALAAKLGRTVPVNQAVIELVRAAERGGKRDWRGDELHAALTRGTTT